MKRYLLASILMSGAASTGMAQTTLFSEDFNSGTAGQFTLNTTDVSSTTSGANDWVVNNAYTGGSGTLVCLGFPFSFTVANTAAQPAGITGSPNSGYMHIRSDVAEASGIHCASFAAADGFCTFAENNFARMTSDISTVGYSTVTLNFWWLCGGSANNFGEVYYSTNGGTNWTLITTPISSYFGQSANWMQQSLSLPAFANQATLRFGFRFVNNTTSAATDPGLAIDDVTIVGTTGGGCTPTTSSTTHTSCGSYTWNGNTYSASGSYDFLTTNAGGCDSTATLNLTVNQPSASSTTHSACGPYVWNGSTYSTSGTYTYTTTNAVGCDSVATLILTVTNIDVSVSQVGPTLTALYSGATYQWLDCNNSNQPISGATSQSYVAPSNGSYAVEISQNGCSNTSACLNVTTIGLGSIASEKVRIYPNPSLGEIFIDAENQPENVSIRVMNVVGQVVYSGSMVTLNKFRVQLPNESGMYMVELTFANGSRKTISVIRN